MRILITGATGLIGSEIIRLSIERGWEVHFLSRQRKRVGEENTRVHGFYWNPATGEIDLRCFEGVDAIINLAGNNVARRWTERYKEAILESRINSLRTLRHALKRSGNKTISHIVSASAIGIYPSSLTELYSEDGPLAQDFLGQVVQQWEREVDTFSALGISVTKLRIGLVLSNEAGALPPMIKSVKTLTAATFGNGKQWQSWIHCEDVAQMFMFCVEKKCKGVFNAVAPNPIIQKKLLKEVARTLRRPILLPGIPRFFMKIILGEMATLLYSSQRVSCKKIETHGFSFSHTSINSAIESLLT
ncbi:MAG: TIGR01777 family oxidoreductase [Bacteroidia bacterium]|nr:TIGR01777 family oxidoreductase [Bacteroidia bacterium]